jgi:uncharacterized protein (TIGR03663 family)
MEGELKWLYVWLWFCVLALAVFLRADDLADRPVHADEATGARILAQQLEGLDYAYNPRHFHGPTLSQLAYPLAQFRGEKDWSSLTIGTLRSSTVLAGVLLVLTPLLWFRSIGPWAALAGAAWLATSPLLVYYSRVYIHESWLALFGMLACAGLYHLTLRPTWGKALATGAVIGLMFATKITVAISLLSWGIAVAGLVLLLRRSDSAKNGVPARPPGSEYLKALVFLALGGFLSSFLFYSNYLTNPLGWIDALRSFFVYEPTRGHEKPATDYAFRLLWPKQFAGLWWTEITVLAFGAAAVLGAKERFCERPATCFLGVSGLAHLLIYSCVGYKTPWLMLLPWAHFCLLAGALLLRLHAARQALRLTILLFILIGLGYQTRQSFAATGRLENHEQNPYVYVPTSRDAASLADWLLSLNTQQPLETIAIVGQEYWPLPWYLKGIDVDIHYWPDAGSIDLSSYPVVLTMPGERDEVRQKLESSHLEFPRSLRRNVPLFMFLDEVIWDRWIENDDDRSDT